MRQALQNTAQSPRPRGVPALSGFSGPARPGLAVGLGLAAAGVTGAAGFAAERLSRERRAAKRLDEKLGAAAFDGDPDEILTVPARDGVELYVEIDRPREFTDGRGVIEPRLDEAADAIDADEGPEVTSDEKADRPTIVFSHGYCLSSRCWIFQRRALRRAGYRVVLWDQRGHGRSGTGDTDTYNVDTLGEDLAAVIEATCPTGPLVLVGHSMGAMTMMSYALTHTAEMRERTVGAAFVATSAGPLADIDIGLGRFGSDVVNKVAPGLTRRLSGVPGLVRGTVDAARDVVDYLVNWGSFGSPVPMSVAKLTTDMITGTDMKVVAAFMPGFAHHDKVEALENFEGREVLVFNGTRDRLTPPSYSDAIVRHLPAAEHTVVEGAGHVIMLEVPGLLNEELLALVRRAERSGTPTDGTPTARPSRHRPALRRATAGQDWHSIHGDYEGAWR